MTLEEMLEKDMVLHEPESRRLWYSQESVQKSKLYKSLSQQLEKHESFFNVK